MPASEGGVMITSIFVIIEGLNCLIEVEVEVEMDEIYTLNLIRIKKRKE